MKFVRNPLRKSSSVKINKYLFGPTITKPPSYTRSPFDIIEISFIEIPTHGARGAYGSGHGDECDGECPGQEGSGEGESFGSHNVTEEDFRNFVDGIIESDEEGYSRIMSNISQRSRGIGDSPAKTVEITEETEVDEIVKELMEEYVRGYSLVYGYTMEEPEIINKKPEKVLLPRPFGITPPPRQKVKKKAEVMPKASTLHIIVDASGSMADRQEFVYKTASYALGYLSYVKSVTDRSHKLYLADISRDEVPYLADIIGNIVYKGRPIRSAAVISNAPIKMYVFSRNAYEAIVAKKATKGSLITAGYIGGGTNPVGAYYLMMKNMSIYDDKISYPIEIKGSKAIIKYKQRRDVLIFITDLIFGSEIEITKELLPLLIDLGLLRAAIIVGPVDYDVFNHDRILVVRNKEDLPAIVSKLSRIYTENRRLEKRSVKIKSGDLKQFLKNAREYVERLKRARRIIL